MRSRNLLDDRIQKRRYPLARAGGDSEYIILAAAQKIGDLVRHDIRLRGVHVDLVHHRDDLKPVVHSQIEIGNRLGLNALRRIHNQQRPLAGCDGAGNLVGKVHMTRSVDQIEDILLSLVGVLHLDGVALDGDSLLLLKIHVIEDLGRHVPAGECLGQFDKPVSQGTLTMVYVGDDTEIPYMLHKYVVLQHTAQTLLSANMSEELQNNHFVVHLVT